MVIEARKTIVWGTVAAAVVSAALLAAGGGGPLVAGLVGDAARSRPVATARAEPPAPTFPESASAAPTTPAH